MEKCKHCKHSIRTTEDPTGRPLYKMSCFGCVEKEVARLEAELKEMKAHYCGYIVCSNRQPKERGRAPSKEGKK